MTDADDKKTYIDPYSKQFVTEEKGQVRPATDEEVDKTTEQWKRDEQVGEDAVKRHNLQISQPSTQNNIYAGTTLRETTMTQSLVKSKPPQPQSSPQAIYYPNRIVRFMGTLYRVVWCNGTHVKLTAGNSGMLYQPYPAGTYWAVDTWIIPVNHIFLSVV